MSTELDIAVVGGGIAGLYFAWRLRHSGLSIAVFECSNKVGGRLYTHVVPGGFPVDLGGMRLLPRSQMPIIHKVIDDLNLSVVDFYSSEDLKKNTCKHFFCGQYVTAEEKVGLYTSERNRAHLVDMEYHDLINWRTDMDWTKLELKDGLKAKNISKYGINAAYCDPLLFNQCDPHYPSDITLADELAWVMIMKNMKYSTVRTGMGSIVDGLASQIQNSSNVRIFTEHRVKIINENPQGETSLILSCPGSEKLVKCKKLILACNARGMELISWNSPLDRSGILQQMFGKVTRVTAFKIFLTFREAWWEKCGLFAGAINTDLPLGEIIALKSKVGGYATLLASFTYKFTDVFLGLNAPENERFEASVGEIPAELKPSKKLVNFVVEQLKLVFDVQEITGPVYAVTKIWASDPIAAANTHYKIGVNVNDMQWTTLKPFSDADIYMTGDTFPITLKQGSLIGWSESSLMTSERILVEYFDLPPIIKGLATKNEWPESISSKL